MSKSVNQWADAIKCRDPIQSTHSSTSDSHRRKLGLSVKTEAELASLSRSAMKSISPTISPTDSLRSTSAMWSFKIDSTHSGGPPPIKRHKKNRTNCNASRSSHQKLMDQFVLLSHIRRSVDQSSNQHMNHSITTLCPKHDMLPVIQEMEKGVFHRAKSNDNAPNHSRDSPHCHHLWPCSGDIYETPCRNLLNDSRDLFEFTFDSNQIAIPFMNALIQNQNNMNSYGTISIQRLPQTGSRDLCVAGRFDLTFKSTHCLSQLHPEQRKQCLNVAVEAISSGTFRTNLSPMPHDRRITKIHDGDGCLIPLAIDGMDLGGFLKISTRQVRNRIGTDSVLGVGFDCSSTSSWNKPRIYWVNQVTRSSLDSQGNLHQDYHENRDLILSLLLPHHFRGSLVIYMDGIVMDQTYTVNTDRKIQQQSRFMHSANHVHSSNTSRDDNDHKSESDDDDNADAATQITSGSWKSVSSYNDLPSRVAFPPMAMNGPDVTAVRAVPTAGSPIPGNCGRLNPGNNTQYTFGYSSNTHHSNISTVSNTSNAPNQSTPLRVTVTNLSTSTKSMNVKAFTSNGIVPGLQSCQSIPSNMVIHPQSQCGSQSQPPTQSQCNLSATCLVMGSPAGPPRLPPGLPGLSGNPIFMRCSNVPNTANSMNPTMASNGAPNRSVSNPSNPSNPSNSSNSKMSSTPSNGQNVDSMITPPPGLPCKPVYTIDQIRTFVKQDLDYRLATNIEVLHGLDFNNETYQKAASQWILLCINRYQLDPKFFQLYLLNIIQSLINSIGDVKTVRGLKKCWLNYNETPNEWSFLHMICSRNLMSLFTAISNLLVVHRHELMVALSQYASTSELKISPFYCCIINGHRQFSAYLMNYFIRTLQSSDLALVLSSETMGKSMIPQLIKYGHTKTLQAIWAKDVAEKRMKTLECLGARGLASPGLASPHPAILSANQVQMVYRHLRWSVGALHHHERTMMKYIVTQREYEEQQKSGDNGADDEKYNVLQLVDLQNDGAEFKCIYAQFLQSAELTPPLLHEIFIYRVVHEARQSAYLDKRKQILRGLKNDNTKLNELGLYHGTKLETLPCILHQGFLRQFATRAVYGKGMYFARDATYSCSPIYAKPDLDEYQHILRCNVVCGEWARGSYEMKVAPPKADNQYVPHETTVNDVLNPSIFVTYQDDQALPTHLISFKRRTPIQQFI